MFVFFDELNLQRLLDQQRSQLHLATTQLLLALIRDHFLLCETLNRHQMIGRAKVAIGDGAPVVVANRVIDYIYSKISVVLPSYRKAHFSESHFPFPHLPHIILL